MKCIFFHSNLVTNKRDKFVKDVSFTVKSIFIKDLQYVAQYPDGTGIRTLKTKTQFLRRLFQLSVNEVFRMKADHFSFKMKVLAS